MSTQIIKNRAIVANRWRPDGGGGGGDYAADAVVGAAAATDTVAEAAIGVAGGIEADRYDHVILPLDRWLAIRQSLDPANCAVGVKLRPEDEVESIAADLDEIALIALEFGSITEGRGYSQAVQLRRQHHFSGEIRALGVHRDNLPLLERCGINAYELAEGEDIEQALSAFTEITEYYPLNGDSGGG